ncbi:MAG TPA: NUMOD3 domain-containing DNA-binding protein [Candidatus Omnitrophota bacterium]|nr:NUMOD3 domain-containing DNA-binding protein [Candidatus Omnitrophota bacterium]
MTLSKKRTLAEAVKRKISRALKGRRNPFYGRKHSKATLLKLSRAAKGKNNPMYGRHHSLATRRKISLARNVR